ncbi:MFS transporter [Pseudonocardia sp. CA-107938]|uniref:MFS transporter n=1 Tax=Pseudonocardia sp. CA-107938 TaxID=3240021 RepID=UPI003D932253
METESRTRVLDRVRGMLADTRPLRTPAYRRLWLAAIVTTIGSQLTLVAVAYQLYDLTGSSAWVGLTGLFGLVPLIVFGLWGGAIADAVDRRTLLLVTVTGIAVTSLLLFVTAATGLGGPWLVLSLVALQTAFIAVDQPTRSAVLPRLLPADQLPAANALTMTVFQTGAVAGPLLAGGLILVTGVPALYLLDAVALLATLWASWRLPPMPQERDGRPRAGLREIVAGFRYAAMHKILLVSFLIDVVAMGFGMPRAVFPELAQVRFAQPFGSGVALGALYAAIPIGMVIAGLFSGWLARVGRQGVAVAASICVWGIGVALFGVTGSIFLAVAFLALAGAGDLVSSVYRSSMLQSVATDEMRGRMQGVFIVVVAGGPRLADMWHGAAADWIGPGAAATVGGVAVVVGAVAVLVAFPAFWRFRVELGQRTPDR